MHRKQSQQIYLRSDSSLNSKNSHRPLLEQTLPKYRKQILQRNLESYNKDLTSRVKQKYRNFGQEDFIKKLKYNSTKQIDRKSVKAIDKYLHELNQQRHQPMGYLHKTNSLKGFNFLNNENISNNENEQSSQPSKINLAKQLSLQIVPVMKNNNSEQTVNIKKQNPNFRGKNSDRLEELSFSDSDEETIKESAKFKQNQSQKRGKLSSGSRDRNFVNIMSFRKNVDGYQSGVNSPSELRQMPRQFMNRQNQLMKKLQEVEESQNMQLLMSDNNFYHKQFISAGTKTPNIYVKVPKQRPTVDTDIKNRQFSQGERWGLSKNTSMLVSQELKMLREKNQEQQEIIKLQEIMIEKLNDQLTKVLEKLEQKEQEGNGCERSYEIYQDQEKINELKALIAKRQANREKQELNCRKMNEELKSYVQSASESWTQGFNKMKSLLFGMQQAQDSQSQQLQGYIGQNFGANENRQQEQNEPQPCYDPPHINLSSALQKDKNEQSANYFYHVSPKQSSNLTGTVSYTKSKSNNNNNNTNNREYSQLSNMYTLTLSMQGQKKEMEYSQIELQGTQFEFDLIEDCGIGGRMDVRMSVI